MFQGVCIYIVRAFSASGQFVHQVKTLHNLRFVALICALCFCGLALAVQTDRQFAISFILFACHFAHVSFRIPLSAT